MERHKEGKMRQEKRFSSNYLPLLQNPRPKLPGHHCVKKVGKGLGISTQVKLLLQVIATSCRDFMILPILL